MSKLPQNQSAVSALLPHHGAAVLIKNVTACDKESITCLADFHKLEYHALMQNNQWPSTSCLEAATQAMCLHGILSHSDSPAPKQVFIGKISNTAFSIPTLSTFKEFDLTINATLSRCNDMGAEYIFSVHSQNTTIASGKALLVLN